MREGRTEHAPELLRQKETHQMNKIDLQNRHAIVTGGAQGIGFAVAERLLASGASVTLWDRDDALLTSAVRDLGGDDTVDAMTADVTDAASVSSAAAATAEKFGKIDILVANAGISGPDLKSWEYPVDVWKQIIEVDLIGVFLCCRAVVPFMLQAKIWPNRKCGVHCGKGRQSERFRLQCRKGWGDCFYQITGEGSG